MKLTSVLDKRRLLVDADRYIEQTDLLRITYSPGRLGAFKLKAFRICDIDRIGFRPGILEENIVLAIATGEFCIFSVFKESRLEKQPLQSSGRSPAS